MSKNIKVEVEYTVKRVIKLDPEDFLEEREELFDEEGDLSDEQGLIDAYKEDLEDDDEKRDEFIADALYKDITVKVRKVQ